MGEIYLFSDSTKKLRFKEEDMVAVLSFGDTLIFQNAEAAREYLRSNGKEEEEMEDLIWHFTSDDAPKCCVRMTY